MEKTLSEQKIEFLKTVAPFSNLNESEIIEIAKHFRTRKYKFRDTILYQGDTSNHVYVIQAGRVSIVTVSESGEESCLQVAGPGDMVGELSAYDGEPRSASVQAVSACTLLVMNGKDFNNYLKSFPGLALSLIKFLSERLRWTTHFLHTLAQYDTAGRLLHLLIYYKEQFGREISEDRIYEVDLSLNQADLAAMVGASREWVNRLLQQWRKKGIITYSRGVITILDLPALIVERDRCEDRLLTSDQNF